MNDKLLFIIALILFIIGAISGFICYVNTSSTYSFILTIINIFLAIFITKEEFLNE